MKHIPEKMREEMQHDPYMRRCCIPDCGRLSSWHHAWEYAGSQINEKWAIMPVCVGHHTNGKEALHRCRKTRELVQYLSLLRATPEDLAKYPKKNWFQIFNYLKQKYGQESCSPEREEG